MAAEKTKPVDDDGAPIFGYRLVPPFTSFEIGLPNGQLLNLTADKVYRTSDRFEIRELDAQTHAVERVDD